MDEYNANSVEILRELERTRQEPGRHVMSDYGRLSTLLEGVDESKRFVIYKRFKAAVRDGVLLAVPVEGVVQIPRKTSPLSVPEHLIASDAVTWLQSVLAEMNKPKKGARRISALESDIVEGKVSFEELAQKYRASLQPKAKPKQARKKTA